MSHRRQSILGEMMGFDRKKRNDNLSLGKLAATGAMLYLGSKLLHVFREK